MSKHWQNGSTTAWKKIRVVVLERDSYRCQLRLATCTTIATCVHHTKSRAVVGDDPRWLVASCTQCNLAVGDPSLANPAPTPRTVW